MGIVSAHQSLWPLGSCNNSWTTGRSDPINCLGFSGRRSDFIYFELRIRSDHDRQSGHINFWDCLDCRPGSISFLPIYSQIADLTVIFVFWIQGWVDGVGQIDPTPLWIPKLTPVCQYQWNRLERLVSKMIYVSTASGMKTPLLTWQTLSLARLVLGGVCRSASTALLIHRLGPM